MCEHICDLFVIFILDIIDPRNDLDQSGETAQNVKSIISEYVKLTGKWTGVYGMDHALRY